MTKKNLKLYLIHKGEDVKSIDDIFRNIKSVDGIDDRYLVRFNRNTDIHIWEKDVKNFIINLRIKKLERLLEE